MSDSIPIKVCPSCGRRDNGGLIPSYGPNDAISELCVCPYGAEQRAKMSDTTKPCPACGKSPDKYLTLAESIERAGYGKTTCTTCLLTEWPREAKRSEKAE